MTDTSKLGAQATGAVAGLIDPRPANDEPASRRLVISGRPVAIRLGKEAWTALDEVSAREELGVDDLCTRIDRQRGEVSFAAAVRVFVASYFMQAGREERRRHAIRRIGPVVVSKTE